MYDRFGNRWQQNGSQSMQLAFTGNSPANPQNNNRMDAYSYDSAGNLMNDGAHSYFYDAENRVVQVDGSAGYCNTQVGSAATACYFYDAFGRRVFRTNFTLDGCDSDGVREILYDLSDRPVADAFNGTSCRTEIYAGGRHLAKQGAGTYYYHSDWLGTVRYVQPYATQDGAYWESCKSLPFGDGMTCSNANQLAESTQHFTDKPRDPETGLDYFGARHNSSGMGRFMSPDAFSYALKTDPQTWNLYSYVANNPLSRTDPLGHDWFYVDKKWQWQKGHVYHDKDGQATKDKGYRYLLEFQKTGTNKLGAAVGTLTLHDQDKVVLQSQGFSGGNGFTIIPDGNFMIRLDIRGNAQDASSLRFDEGANTTVMKQFYGIQQIAPTIQGPNGEALDGRYEWGSLRAALNPFPGQKGDAFQGNYLHGKNRQGDYTHGCICERSETILHFLLNNIDPAQNSHVPLSVEGSTNP